MNAVHEKTEDLTDLFIACEHDSSSPSAQHDPAGALGSSNTAPASRASSSPLSSPQSLSSLSFPPPTSRSLASSAPYSHPSNVEDNSAVSASSALYSHPSNVEDSSAVSGAPARLRSRHHSSPSREKTPSPDLAISPPIENYRNDSVSAQTDVHKLGSDELAASCTDVHDDADPECTEEAGRPANACDIVSNATFGPVSSVNHHSALPPSSVVESISEMSEEDSTWTTKRLRSNSGTGAELGQGHQPGAQNTSTKTKRGKQRKASVSDHSPPAANRASPGPLVASINQIGRTNTIADIQEAFQDLKGRRHRLHDPAESVQSRIPIRIDTAPAQIIEATRNLAREIKGNTVNEQLSRVRNRIALADFYCAYRAAHAEPYIFLQELDRSLSQYTHQPQASHRTRRAEIKHRFIELVFNQATRERDRKKNSTRVNNWQKGGRPWFELIDRFGTGILLLVPEDVTNCR